MFLSLLLQLSCYTLHLQVSEEKAPDSWDDISELCSLKVFLSHAFISSLNSGHIGNLWSKMTINLYMQIYGVKALVKSYLPTKDAHLRSGIDDLFRILKNILSFGDISSEIRSRYLGCFI